MTAHSRSIRRVADGGVPAASRLRVGQRAWWLLLPLCFGSGCAALIYEVVWFQLLGLVIGASVVSLGVVLATFMAGLCIGSLLLWRLVSPARHPLRVFACLELGIGVLGLALLYCMPALGNLYAASGAGGAGGLVLRAGVAALCLLPPTVLMGATLPAIARFLESTPRGVSRMGQLYAANLIGAVAGSLAAGFYLLRAHDVAAATFVAVGLNVAVGIASFALASRAVYAASPGLARPPSRKPIELRAGAWPVYVAIAFSGMTALAAQVIWTRNLALLLGGTVYTFALILAVFLLGIGLGSAAGSVLSRKLAPRATLAACQFLLCAAIAWAAWAIAASLPYWPLDVTLPITHWVALQLDLIRVASAVLPATLLWGASFPLALAAAAAGERDPGRLLGGIYAANTLGAIIGASAASFLLVAWLGSLGSQQLLIAASAAAALLVFLSMPAGDRRDRAAQARRSAALRPRHGAAVAAGAVAVALGWSTPDLPGELIAFGRFMPTRAPEAEVIYQAEGIASSVAVSRDRNGRLTYHAAGKAQASTYPQDMRLQRMLGHLATLVPERAESFLVIGLGAGVTAGAVSADPSVRRIVVAELEPLAAEVAADYFAPYNHSVLQDPRVELRFDDGRHVLATGAETFDGIISDPLDPWVKGAAALYTREFWQLAEARLNPGGVVTVFLQLYETTEEAVRSEIATFFEVFENGAVFANTIRGTGYDAVLVGRAGGAPIDVDLVHARLASPQYSLVAGSLAEVGFRSAADLLGTYAGSRKDLAHWLQGAAINRDRNLRLQYLAGQGLNVYRADQIHGRMIEGSSAVPPHVFKGSPRQLEALSRAVRVERRRGN